MKRILSIFAVIYLLAVSTSCNDWLEANSSTRIPAEKLLTDRYGFQDALSGVYITLGGSYLYGGAMSFTIADYPVQPYVYQTLQSSKAIQEHNYEQYGAKVAISNMWRYCYNAIANINLALSYLTPDKFSSEDEYNLFLGEFLGLRAYMHLELIRLYGIWDVTGSNAQKKTVPYVTTFSKEPTNQLSYEETFKLFNKDLDEAILCLETSDPIAGNITKERLNAINSDGYWTNRQKHFNYYAALALKARYCQWTNDKENAAFLAKKITDNAFDAGLVEWVDPEILVSDVSDYYKDFSFSSEHVFSLEITNLSTLASTLMIPLGTSQAGICFPESYINNTLYPGTSGMEDVRGPAFLLRYNMSNYYCYKMYSISGSAYRDRFPMIKISEMYFIRAEYLISTGDNKGALTLLNEVRRHRGVTDDFAETAVAEVELMKEYYREVVNEGQLIYWLKHKQVTTSIYEPFILTGPKDLVFPYPDEEINYGRVQEF